MNLTTLIENKSKEFDKKFDIKKIINTIDTNGTIEIEHSVTKEQLNFLSQSIKAGYELAIKEFSDIIDNGFDKDFGTYDYDQIATEFIVKLQSLLKEEL